MFTSASTKPMIAAGMARIGITHPTTAPTTRIANETAVLTIVSSYVIRSVASGPALGWR